MKPLLLLLALSWPLQPMDDAIREAVQDVRRPGFERPMRAASDIGKPAVVLGVLLAVAVFGGPTGPAVAREVLLTLAATNAVVEGAKRATYRARPDGEHKRSNAAFPSSHTANAFAIAVALSWRYRRALVPMLFGASVVGFSRMYLDRHWMSDVLAGVVVGVGCALAAHAWLSRRRHPGRPAPGGPAASA